MKSNKILLQALMLCCLLFSCKPEYPVITEKKHFTVTAKVEQGNSYNSFIDKVRVYYYDYYEQDLLFSCDYKNGGFSLELPDVVDEKYLNKFQLQGLTVSDNNLRVLCIGTDTDNEFEAYKGNEYVGVFYYFQEDAGYDVFAFYLYADRDATVKGTTYESGYEEYYNLTLKKGWNTVFGIDGDPNTYTTQTQNGLKWYFEED